MTTKEKYINPFTDFGFKKLFGEEVNKDLLIDFLNELINEQGQITAVRYLKTEQLGSVALDRKAIFDIYCENDRGEKFIVEMQKAKQDFFKERSVFYSTFPIREQAASGEWKYDLKAVYMVGILDFVFDEDKDDEQYYHREIKLMDTLKKKVFYDKLTFIYLEMPKFNKTEAELETRFDKWMYVLKNLPKLESRPVKLQEKVFERLFKAAEIAQFTVAEMEAYEDSLKVYRDMKNVVDTARREGEEKGKTEGKAEGKLEERIEIATQMLIDNEPFEKIIRYTKLTAEQIDVLRKQLLSRQ